MKRFVKILAAIFLIAIMSVSMTSCGMAWKQTVKNIGSDLGGGLSREILVKNSYTGEVLWAFRGKAYIDNESKAGDVVIIYTNSDGEQKKYDALGTFIQVTSNEL